MSGSRSDILHSNTVCRTVQIHTLFSATLVAKQLSIIDKT